ncbi:MAG: NAD(P)H-quinone oxidoreductase subunit D4, partial [Kamptonema sp. SIO4C4]|nr:NAD(P)H-quinone oxidoreductase subunit D4 [Kamptonema sp. SIO4C4]
MLTTLLLLPLIGALIVAVLPAGWNAGKIRQVTGSFALLCFLWSIYLLSQFDLSNGGFQFTEYLAWAEPIGLSYSLGVDGLSLPLLVLSALLTWIAIYTTGKNVERPRLYYALILLVNSGVAGALMANNL